MADLKAMLHGRYAGLLPEFFDLLATYRLRIPPEWAPDLLEWAARKHEMAEQIMSATQPVGAWLARQNPRWEALTQEENDDWFTASFAERKRLLSRTRARNPLLALAWLEKTWSEEKAEHKIQFLEILRVKPSAMDEDLLERAFSEKNRDLRLAALHALTLLPGSRKLRKMEILFQERLAPALNASGREKALKKALPDLSEDALLPWIGLTPPAARAEWRNELLMLLLGMIPPARLLEITGWSREKTLEELDDEKDAASLVGAILHHADMGWTEAVLQHFCLNFRHPVWRTKNMAAFLLRYAPQVMSFLHQKSIPIGHENEFFLRALEDYHEPWPETMLLQLLGQYERTAGQGKSEIPGWHYASALQTAAYHCRPDDAVKSEFVRSSLVNPSQRPKEFDDFLAVLRFRQMMKTHVKMTVEGH
ncbi:MAG: hypothetical protein KA165_05560 [Saprospiraceae bacterium]|nr:hypothetical protein [Saprospiraceae bacterium]